MKNTMNLFLGGEVRGAISRLNKDIFSGIREVRLRVNRPLSCMYGYDIIYINKNGETCNFNDAYIVTQSDIRLTSEIMGGYSLYAFDEELKMGFITIEGGHRVGVCGKAVVENGSIKTIRQISSLNIRIAREVIGCGDSLISAIKNKDRLYNTLIVSSPGGGKTTILRDVIRSLSYGIGELRPRNIGVCDERGEIGASYMGIPQNDIGPMTDILDSCPKAKGIMMLIRSMSPEVIAVDEIGSKKDIEAIRVALASGVNLICTAHGGSILDIKKRFDIKGIFDRYIFLKGARNVGEIDTIYDGELKEVKCLDN